LLSVKIFIERLETFIECHCALTRSNKRSALFLKNACDPSRLQDKLRTYYLTVRIDGAWVGTYVRANDMAGAFAAAEWKCKLKYPRENVEVLFGQEMAGPASFFGASVASSLALPL